MRCDSSLTSGCITRQTREISGPYKGTKVSLGIMLQVKPENFQVPTKNHYKSKPKLCRDPKPLALYLLTAPKLTFTWTWNFSGLTCNSEPSLNSTPLSHLTDSLHIHDYHYVRKKHPLRLLILPTNSQSVMYILFPIDTTQKKHKSCITALHPPSRKCIDHPETPTTHIPKVFHTTYMNLLFLSSRQKINTRASSDIFFLYTENIY